MTEGSGAMTGGSIGVWAIAIVILLAMFGGGNGFFGNHYGWNNCGNGNWGNDCVTNRNLLEFGFYNMNNTNNKIEALATQNAQEFFNLRTTIDQNELNRVKDELSQTRTALAMEKQARYMDGQFAFVNGELANIRCNMLQKPPVYGCASFPANGCGFPQASTTPAA